jgi:hypothetical protein
MGHRAITLAHAFPQLRFRLPIEYLPDGISFGLEGGMDIKRMTYFRISTRDRPGAMAQFSKTMLAHKINLAGVWCFGIGRGDADIVAIPRDPHAFKKAIKEDWPTYREGDCFHLTGEDRAGALSETLDRIAQEGINLQAVDAMGFETAYSAYVWCNPEDVEALRKLLKGC